MLDFTLSGNAYFDGIPQPVLLAQDGAIQYYNPAAAELFALTETPLKAGEALPAGFPLEAGTLVEVQIGGRPWSVQTRGVESGVLYLLRAADGERGLSQERIEQLAVQMRLLMSPLSLSIEALQKSMVETEQTRNDPWISRLNHSQHQLLRLVDHLDFYGHSDEDLAMLYPPAVLDLAGLCRELERILSYLAGQVGRSFAYRESQSSLLVSCNEYLIRKLVYNLTSNAFRAGGNVTMRLEKKGNRAFLTLEDDCEGIAPERLALLFSPEEDRPLLENILGGFGLGLPICRRIAQLSGGGLMVAPGKKGTTVSLSLPLCTAEQAGMLRAKEIFQPEPSYNQVLIELSDVLPSSCYGQEAVF